MIVMGNTPEPDAALKILTPWWDMLTRYLTGGIMTIALSTTALQAAKDNLVCVPAIACKGPNVVPMSHLTQSLESTCRSAMDKLQNDTTADVIKTMVDRRQYDFIDCLCFQKELKWYPCYFPFILVAMAACLLMIDNIWVMFPKISSSLNHFVSLTMECYSSVGTNLDIFRVLAQSKDSPNKEPKESKESEDNEDEGVEGDDEDAKSFDLSQAMNVRTLYDKVEQFRERHGGEHRFLINVYQIQAVLEIMFSFVCLFLSAFYYEELENSIECHLKEVFNIPYQYFVCSRFIAPYYRAITVIFCAAMFIYLITAMYTLFWTFRNSYRKNIYASVHVDDTTNVKGDLAFLFSLLEQYNTLYCDRLAQFLARGFKKTLDREIATNRERKSILRKASMKHEVDSKGKQPKKKYQ